MNNVLTIVAKIEAHNDKVEFVKAELLKLIEPTLKEAGCIQYDLHQDNEDPSVFVFYEQWESRELLQAHLNSPHLIGYVKGTEGMVSLSVLKMTKL